MKNLITALAILLLSTGAHAQLKKGHANAIADKLPAPQLLTQFVSAIKPASFIASWAGQKNSWLSKAGKATDAAGLAQSVASLAGFISPAMLKSGFNVNTVIQAVATAKTLKEAGGLLQTLEAGLKPEATITEWSSQRTGWLTGLSMLK